MSSDVLAAMMRQIEVLSGDEQLQLLSALEEALRRDGQSTRRPWREIQGKAQHPLLGEDAQAWVSRTRGESDEENNSFNITPITPGIAELAHDIEKTRLETGVSTEELIEGLLSERQHYYQEKYGQTGATE